MNSVWAVVVTYNPDESLLRDQFEAIRNQVDGIIYVDNHSRSTGFITSINSNNVVVVINSTNLGLAKAQNKGVEKARQEGAEFILLLDQDSIPSDFYVEKLLLCYKNASLVGNVALVGPVVGNKFLNNVSDNSGIIIRGIGIKKIPIGDMTEVSYCISSGSLIPMNVFLVVGGMAENLFIDGLDIEWCFRARHKGFVIFQTQAAVLSHCLGDGSSRRIRSHSPLREFYIMRNSIWMIKQSYIPLGYRIRKVFSSIGRILQSMACMDFSYLKAEIKGVASGICL